MTSKEIAWYLNVLSGHTLPICQEMCSIIAREKVSKHDRMMLTWMLADLQEYISELRKKMTIGEINASDKR